MWFVFVGLLIFIVIILWMSKSTNRRSMAIPKSWSVLRSLWRQQLEDPEGIEHREEKRKKMQRWRTGERDRF